MLDVQQPVNRTAAVSLPPWIRLLDWAVVGFLVMSAAVLAFGGFRERIGGILLSIRSWDHLLAIACLVAALRYVCRPAPHLHEVLFAEISTFWRSEARRQIWPAFVSTRLAVLVAGYLAVVTIGFAPGSELFRISRDPLENLVARWDSGWYLRIVDEGYNWNGNASDQQNVVFFPAFPLAMKILGLFIGKRWLIAGLLLALSAFFFALIYLYRLARERLDADQAQAAVATLAAYPFSIYYSAPYTEAFFLLGSVGAFYHLVREQWWRCAAWAFFVALCRPNGFLIAVPIALLVVQRARRHRLEPPALAPIIAPVLGILAYCAFLYAEVDDPLAWSKGQLAWGRVYMGVWPATKALFVDRFEAISYYGAIGYVAYTPYDALHTAAALFVLVSIWPTIRRFGFAYGLFIVVNIVPPLIIGGMMSIGRMTSVLFPVFLWLGSTLSARSLPAWIAVSCILQGLVAVLFFTWRPMF
jgi:hypothetical protein